MNNEKVLNYAKQLVKVFQEGKTVPKEFLALSKNIVSEGLEDDVIDMLDLLGGAYADKAKHVDSTMVAFEKLKSNLKNRVREQRKAKLASEIDEEDIIKK